MATNEYSHFIDQQIKNLGESGVGRLAKYAGKGHNEDNRILQEVIDSEVPQLALAGLDPRNLRDAAKMTAVGGYADGVLNEFNRERPFSPGFMSRISESRESNFKEGLDSISSRHGKGANNVITGVGKAYDYATNENYEDEMNQARASFDSDQFISPLASQGALAGDVDKFEYSKINKGIPIALEAAKISANTRQLNKLFDFRNQGVSREQVEEYLTTSGVNNASMQAWREGLDKVYGSPMENATGPVQDKQIAAVSHQVSNKSQGKGNDVGLVKPRKEEIEPMGEAQVFENAIDKVSTTLSRQHSIPENWYDNQAMNMALIRFGLGLLSGEDYATAFSYAANDYGNYDSKLKRKSMYDELLSEGYDEPSIMQWIDSGDAAHLTKPEPVKPSEKWETRRDSNGLQYQVNTLTGKRDYLPGTLQGGVEGGSGSSGQFQMPKKFTESQARAGSFASRAEYGLKDFHDLWQKATDEMKSSSMTPDFAYKAFSDRFGLGAEGTFDALALRGLEANYPAMADYRKNAMTALMPLIRDDSGAAIGKAEEQKEFMAYIPAPGASPEQYKRQMDGLMERVIYTGVKAGKPEYQAAQYLISKKAVVPVPTSEGIRFVDPNNPTGGIYSASQLLQMVNNGG